MRIYRLRYRQHYLLVGLVILFLFAMYSFVGHNQQTLILDKDRHLFIRLFKENDPNRKIIRPFRILSGSLHYFRVLPQQWSERIEQMKKAGLNTIETYVPWNLHEKERGVFQFNEGLADLISFLKLVHKHEMFTIVRPSGRLINQSQSNFKILLFFFKKGYICAEWEWGGLPSWLLEDDTMRVRSTHSEFMKSLRNYYSNLLPILAEHQYNRNDEGSIIAFQIENEYGSYGSDKEYLQMIYSMYNEFGLNELYFTSDGANDLSKGALNDVWATVNFQGNVERNIEKLVQFRANSHLMITEYWTGWFDYWSGKHRTGSSGLYSAEEFQQDLEKILFHPTYDISINFYMFFGGTNFGFTSGGHHFPDQNYTPLVTSYDYDAPMNECGDPTEKYYVIQKLLYKFYEKNPHLIIYNHQRTSRDRFEIVSIKNSKKISYGDIDIQGYKTFEQILANDILTKQILIDSNSRLNMEQLSLKNEIHGLRQGFIVYTNTELVKYLQNIHEPFITIPSIADNALILSNGKVIHKSLHRDNSIRFSIPRDTINLTIIVENMGRINFGPRLDQSRKGILDKVLLNNSIQLTQWTIHGLEFRQGMSSIADWQKLGTSSNEIADLNNGPQLFYASLDIKDEKSIADTYLYLDSQWTKGVAFINGFNLGRYWSVGPQRTLYIPKELLFKGFNHIQLFELYTHGKSIQLVDRPILNSP